MAPLLIEAAPVLQTVYAAPVDGPLAAFNGLTQAPDGNFYGTAPSTNAGRGGVIFRITPAGAYSTVQTFTGPNGAAPEGPLLLASDGKLYGTTIAGGTYGLGTLFRLTPGGTPQTIHSFGGPEGASPSFNLIQASDGYFYGVTLGGSTNPPLVFRADTNGAIVTITNLNNLFANAPQSPNDGLVEGPDGALYGTTQTSGAQTTTIIGSIFRITKSGARVSLAVFQGSSFPLTTGYRPIAGLTSGGDGFLYGTVGFSYLSGAGTNSGWVFRMTTNGSMTTLCTFYTTNGSNPGSRLLLAADGNFYGLTGSGGSYGKGTVFQVSTNGLLTTLASFTATNGGVVGGFLAPSLIQSTDANLYGVSHVAAGRLGFPLAFRCVEPPMLTGTARLNAGLTLTWNSFVNARYNILYKTSLDASTWLSLASTITAAGPTTSFTDFGPAPRYYQVVLLP